MAQPFDKYYTELDKDLQNLAALEWHTFVQLIGEDVITQAKICLLRARGKSMGQIATKFGKVKSTVQYTTENKCKCD